MWQARGPEVVNVAGQLPSSASIHPAAAIPPDTLFLEASAEPFRLHQAIMDGDFEFVCENYSFYFVILNFFF